MYAIQQILTVTEFATPVIRNLEHQILNIAFTHNPSLLPDKSFQWALTRVGIVMDLKSNFIRILRFLDRKHFGILDRTARK